MIALLAIAAALAADPCPGLHGPTDASAGSPVPDGVVVAGRLACDGLLLSTEDARAPLVHAQELELELVAVRQELVAARAALELEREARRDAELQARVAESRLDLAQPAPARRLPAWLPVAGGVGLGLAACWVAPGAPQWASQ